MGDSVVGKLDNKIALITGGNSGMGLETARRFVQEGAKVIITGRRQHELDAALLYIGENIEAVQGDVSNIADLDRLYTHIHNVYGRIDVLFANAGVAELSSLEVASELHFDKHFDINVKGLFFTVQKALPLMPMGSSIILNSSIAAEKGMDNFSVYSATKAAVRSFARSWTSELRERKIRINAISPGPIDTPIFGKMGLNDEQVQNFSAAITQQVPLGRLGTTAEIASVVLFLASNESSYVSGINLSVDGGMAQI